MSEWWHDTGLVAQWLRALDYLYPNTNSSLIHAVENARKYSREEVEATIARYFDVADADWAVG